MGLMAVAVRLGGYVGPLLWGTHMVGSGVERGFGAELRLWLGRTLSRRGGRARFYACLAGLAVTAVLQSSTATGLMVTSFTASGAIGLAPTLAVKQPGLAGSHPSAEAGAAEALAQPRHERPNYAFFAGFFFAEVATERTVLTLAAPALPASFFDMAIGFTPA